MTSARVNPGHRLDDQGISGLGQVHYNLIEPALIDAALTRGEGSLGRGGSFLVSTGKHTGRSPKDKFVVRTVSVEDTIWWDNNSPMTSEAFDLLYADMKAHMQGGEYFVQDLYAGADEEYRLDVRVVTELAWHGLFIRHLLRRPAAEELATFAPEFTIVNCPSFKADPDRHGCRSDTVIALNLDAKLILIGGTAYAGENKKSVFTLLNYLLPEQGVMPMHCSANHAADDPSDSAVFFGLSGTGKTTLSADPDRVLIGDDEHGWSDRGVFNFEGGCYAKTINLSAEAEPEIFATTEKFGTVIENMVFDPDTLELDFEDDSLTANMRCAYPLDYISNASATGLGGMPKNIIMLTCDAFGVLPPIARLTPAQAMYHFLSGFTAKVAGTERGVTEPQPTFSTCFGAPFMPRRPEVYGDLLRRKIAEHGSVCWLVNTGWTGGAYGTGNRMPIKATRTLLTAALDGSLNEGQFRRDPNFGFEVPLTCEGVDESLLDPRSTWEEAVHYDMQAAKLVQMFSSNFGQYAPFIDERRQGRSHLLIAVAAALTVAAPALAAPPAPITSDIVKDFAAGLYCAGEPIDRVDAPGTASGSVNVINAPTEFIVETQRIPAVPGIAFGVLFSLQAGLDFDATIVTTHPPFPGLGISEETWTSNLDDGLNLNGFTLEHAYELQPGTWSFTATYEDEVVYSIEFEIVDPALAPELSGICAGFVMS